MCFPSIVVILILASVTACATTNDLQSQIDEVKSSQRYLLRRIEDLTNEINSLNNKNAKQDEALVSCLHNGYDRRRQRQVLDSPNTAVSFSARISRDIKPIGSGQTIIFDDVITNVGNGYHNPGIFIAPASGYYELTMTIRAPPNEPIDLQMLKNGAEICSSTSTNWVTGTCVTIVNLAVGDHVWISHPAGVSLNGHLIQFSSFTGHLISLLQ